MEDQVLALVFYDPLPVVMSLLQTGLMFYSTTTGQRHFAAIWPVRLA